MAILDYVLFGSEQRQQMRALRTAMTLFFLFIISGAMSYSELHFMMFGVIARAHADVIRRSESPTSDSVKIQYDFVDKKGDRHEARTNLSETRLEEAKNEDGTVEVVYISGAPANNKLSIERGQGWLVIFGAMSVAVVVWVAVIYFNAVKDEKPKAKKKRAR